MGKSAMCLKMLQVLNTGRVYKVSELASILDTNPRNIIEYKKELDEVAFLHGGGFYIETIPGRNGGYKLNGNALIPSLKLTPREKEALIKSFNYSLKRKDFLEKDMLISGFSKVISNVDIDQKENDLLIVNKYQISMDDKNIQERYEFIQRAIKEKRTIKILYLSMDNGEKIHFLDPYKIVTYNNSLVFLAWNHEAGDVHFFRINKILKYEMTDKKFVVWKQFKAENYFDQSGFRAGGKYEHIVLLAKGGRAVLFKEKTYGKNQTIEEQGDGSIKVSLDMQNKKGIVSFALSCGDEVKILEPKWLIEELKEKAKKITEKY